MPTSLLDSPDFLRRDGLSARRNGLPAGVPDAHRSDNDRYHRKHQGGTSHTETSQSFSCCTLAHVKPSFTSSRLRSSPTPSHGLPAPASPGTATQTAGPDIHGLCAPTVDTSGQLYLATVGAKPPRA